MKSVLKTLMVTLALPLAVYGHEESHKQSSTVKDCADLATSQQVEKAIEELARFLIEIQNMSEGSDKLTAVKEFTARYELYKNIEGFQKTFDAKVDEFSTRAATQSQRQQAREKKARQQQVSATKWFQRDEFTTPDVPKQLWPLDEDRVLIPQRNRLVVYSVSLKQVTAEYPAKDIDTWSYVIATRDGRTAYVVSAQIFKFDLSRLGQAPIKISEVVGPCHSVGLSPNEDMIAVGGNGALSVYATNDLTEIFSHSYKTNSTYQALFSDSGRYALGPTSSGYHVLIDTQTKKLIEFPKSMPAKDREWKDAVFIPGQDAILFASPGDELRIFDIARNKFLTTPVTWAKIHHFRISPDGNSVVLWREKPIKGETIAIFDLHTGQQKPITLPRDWEGTALAAENSDQLVLVDRFSKGADTLSGVIIDLEQLTARIAFPGDVWKHTDWLQAKGYFTPNGHVLFLGSDDSDKKTILRFK